jgi:O-methyltransferase involved in polyketide biosynthesis
MPAKTEATRPGEKAKVALSGAQQTLLGTLMLRAVDAKSPRPVLNDPYAQATIDQIETEWSKIALFSPGNTLVTSVALRARRLDRWTMEYLQTHDEGM